MSHSKKWVYVAGPYTIPDPVENTNDAMVLADQLLNMGVIPIIPHMTLAWHLVHPRPAKFWYWYTLELMKRCDAVFRKPGESTGADDEVTYAKKHGIPVVYNLAELMKWLKENG